VAGRFTLLSNGSPEAPDEVKHDTRHLPELLSKVREHGKHLVSAAPGQSGLLYEGGRWYNYRPVSQEVMRFRNKIKEVCDRHNVPLSAAALQFPALGGASAVVCGASSAAELQNSLKDFDRPLPVALWQELEARHLINDTLGVSRNAQSKNRRSNGL
jgi:D-threo-aldose 1-dehydrogenase